MQIVFLRFQIIGELHPTKVKSLWIGDQSSKECKYCEHLNIWYLSKTWGLNLESVITTCNPRN